jgi:tetratricopeptide (TPR) repeat protein
VHLHGRHTGYRLANTNEQIRQIDPNLRSGFIEHLRGSHLVVIGYSGWDDMVMNVLKEWRNDDTIVRGLFWIPYRSEENILPSVKTFLDECPIGKAHVIVNQGRDLNADSFMLSLCKAINRKKDGFKLYRNDVIRFAQSQHAFTLTQLKDHPTENPELSIAIAKTALKTFLGGAGTGAVDVLLKQARSLIAPDLPDLIRGKSLLYIGTVELLIGKCEEALATLESALLLWNIDDPSADAILLRFRNLMALGFTQLRLQRTQRARERFAEAISTAERKSLRAADKAIALAASGINYLRIDPQLARVQFMNALQHLPKNGRYAFAEISRLSGYADFFTKLANEADSKLKKGEEKLLKAVSIFEDLGDVVALGHALRNLANVLIQSKKVDEAEIMLARAEQLFCAAKCEAGQALALATRGDLYSRCRAYADAVSAYDRAIEMLRRQNQSRAGDEVAIDRAVAKMFAAISAGVPGAREQGLMELEAMQLGEGSARLRPLLEHLKSRLDLAAEDVIKTEEILSLSQENPDMSETMPHAEQ